MFFDIRENFGFLMDCLLKSDSNKIFEKMNTHDIVRSSEMTGRKILYV